MNIPDDVRSAVDRIADRPDDNRAAERRETALDARDNRSSQRPEPAEIARPVERPATIVDLSDDAKRYLETREAERPAPTDKPAEPREAARAETVPARETPPEPPAPEVEARFDATGDRGQSEISAAATDAATQARAADVAAEESRRPDAPGNDTQNGARIDIQRFRDELDARVKVGVEARMNPAEITRAVSAYGQA